MTVHGTKQQAEEELTRQLAAVTTGISVEPDTVTLGQYLRGYLEAGTTYSQQAWKDMVTSSTRQAAPIAHIQVQRLKPVHVKTWLDGMRAHGGKNGKPLSAVSVKHAHRALRAALQAAVRLNSSRGMLRRSEATSGRSGRGPYPGA